MTIPKRPHQSKWRDRRGVMTDEWLGWHLMNTHKIDLAKVKEQIRNARQVLANNGKPLVEKAKKEDWQEKEFSMWGIGE